MFETALQLNSTHAVLGHRFPAEALCRDDGLLLASGLRCSSLSRTLPSTQFLNRTHGIDAQVIGCPRRGFTVRNRPHLVSERASRCFGPICERHRQRGRFERC